MGTSRFYRWVNGRLENLDYRQDGRDLHFVQDDTMPPTLNHVDGKMYTSKSEMLKSYKRTGHECVGNDLLSKQKKKEIKDPLTDDRIFDAYLKAEAQLKEPGFIEHFRYKQFETLERLQKDGFRP